MRKGELRSGLIFAGAYANKLRRTMFAQTKPYVKSGELSNQEVARAVGELNEALYRKLVEEMQLDKGDVVRISILYTISNGQVRWLWDTLEVEVWKATSSIVIRKGDLDEEEE